MLFSLTSVELLFYIVVYVLVTQLTLCDPMDVGCQAPLSMGFLRQEHWSGLPRPSLGNLPNPGIKAACPAL